MQKSMNKMGIFVTVSRKMVHIYVHLYIFAEMAGDFCKVKGV